MNGGAENHGRDAAEVGRQRVGGHATEVIATAPQALVLPGLELIRLDGVFVTMLSMRGRLLSIERVQPSGRITAAERQGE